MRIRDEECAQLREILAKGRSAVGLPPAAEAPKGNPSGASQSTEGQGPQAEGHAKTAQEADEMLAQFLDTIKSMLTVVPNSREFQRSGYSMPTYRQ